MFPCADGDFFYQPPPPPPPPPPPDDPPPPLPELDPGAVEEEEMALDSELPSEEEKPPTLKALHATP